MILAVLAEILAELFLNVQLRKHKVLNRLFWSVLVMLGAIAIVLGLVR